MIVTDEETGLGYCTERLLSEGYRLRVCLMPGGTKNWQVEAIAKVVLHLELVASKETGHASKPLLALSANEQMVDPLHEVCALFLYHQRSDMGTLNIGYIN
jgi:hypothetical protein